MIGVAVLGAGRIGKIHARNVTLNPRCKLVAVADPIREAASALAGALGAEAMTDARAAIARPDVQAIVVGTPTDTHVDFTLDAARRGKAVLCEKPIDLDITKADAAVAEIEKLGAKVMIAFNRRFDPSNQAMRKAMDAGAIGEVHQVIITSRDPSPPPATYTNSGGIFRDMTIHDFDMARFLLGEEPVEVVASASCLVDPAIGKSGDFDTLMVILKTGSGRQCHINNSRKAVYGYDQRFEVFGSSGMLMNDNLRATTLRGYTEAQTEIREPLLNFFLERYDAAYRSELDAFIDAVADGKPMPVTARDGRQALRLADAALESATTGRAVKVEMPMRDIGVGVIGTGFMGKAHAFAYRAVSGIFPVSLRPVLRMVADNNRDAGLAAQKQLGFETFTADWTELVRDPGLEIVSITTPNVVHREMALAAISQGKHVHCEKPIAPNAEDARAMMEAAEAKGVKTQVGYNYIKNPLLVLARDMIASGELGEITGFRGIHAEDYMADPEVPYSWRVDQSGGGGAVADLGSHIVGMARFLLRPIASVNADLETIVKSRPVAPGASERREVKVDDIARLTVRFARGCGGQIEANWVATGRNMDLGFELYGTKGSLAFTQANFNELLYYKAGGPMGRKGYQKIESGPEHYPYGLFCVAPGHQLGFNDLKTIEVADFLEAIAGGKSKGPDFREAWEIQKVIDTAIRSSRERRWLDIA